VQKNVELATVVMKSDPDGADVLVDGKFAGNVPSTMQLPPGDHMISNGEAWFQRLAANYYPDSGRYWDSQCQVGEAAVRFGQTAAVRPENRE
jgi:PEGA domain